MAVRRTNDRARARRSGRARVQLQPAVPAHRPRRRALLADRRCAFSVCSWAVACPVYGVLPAIKQVLGGYRTAMKDPFANEV